MSRPGFLEPLFESKKGEERAKKGLLNYTRKAKGHQKCLFCHLKFPIQSSTL